MEVRRAPKRSGMAAGIEIKSIVHQAAVVTAVVFDKQAAGSCCLQTFLQMRSTQSRKDKVLRLVDTATAGTQQP